MRKLISLFLILPAIAFAHEVSRNIKIVPLSSMDFPESLQKEMAVHNLSNKTKGYFETDNEYARKLLKMSYEPQIFSQSPDPEDTNLKKNISEIKLNFQYKTILPNIIAYAPLGIYTKEGWAGIKTFFNGKEMGTCTLSVFNISKVKESMQLNKDNLIYAINDKPTRITVEGSYNSGFMYSVRWYDRNFVRDLECANLNFDKRITKSMIALANKVDKE